MDHNSRSRKYKIPKGDTFSDAITNNGNSASIISAGHHAQGYSQNGSVSDVNIKVNYQLANQNQRRPPQKTMQKK